MASGIQSASDTLNCTVAFVFSLLTFIPPGPLLRQYVIVSFSVNSKRDYLTVIYFTLNIIGRILTHWDVSTEFVGFVLRWL